MADSTSSVDRSQDEKDVGTHVEIVSSNERGLRVNGEDGEDHEHEPKVSSIFCLSSHARLV